MREKAREIRGLTYVPFWALKVHLMNRNEKYLVNVMKSLGIIMVILLWPTVMVNLMHYSVFFGVSFCLECCHLGYVKQRE